MRRYAKQLNTMAQQVDNWQPRGPARFATRASKFCLGGDHALLVYSKGAGPSMPDVSRPGWTRSIVQVAGFEVWSSTQQEDGSVQSSCTMQPGCTMRVRSNPQGACEWDLVEARPEYKGCWVAGAWHDDEQRAVIVLHDKGPRPAWLPYLPPRPAEKTTVHNQDKIAISKNIQSGGKVEVKLIVDQKMTDMKCEADLIISPDKVELYLSEDMRDFCKGKFDCGIQVLGETQLVKMVSNEGPPDYPAELPPGAQELPIPGAPTIGEDAAAELLLGLGVGVLPPGSDGKQRRMIKITMPVELQEPVPVFLGREESKTYAVLVNFVDCLQRIAAGQRAQPEFLLADENYKPASPEVRMNTTQLETRAGCEKVKNWRCSMRLGKPVWGIETGKNMGMLVDKGTRYLEQARHAMALKPPKERKDGRREKKEKKEGSRRERKKRDIAEFVKPPPVKRRGPAAAGAGGASAAASSGKAAVDPQWLGDIPLETLQALEPVPTPRTLEWWATLVDDINGPPKEGTNIGTPSALATTKVSLKAVQMLRKLYTHLVSREGKRTFLAITAKTNQDDPVLTSRPLLNELIQFLWIKQRELHTQLVELGISPDKVAHHMAVYCCPRNDPECLKLDMYFTLGTEKPLRSVKEVMRRLAAYKPVQDTPADATEAGEEAETRKPAQPAKPTRKRKRGAAAAAALAAEEQAAAQDGTTEDEGKVTEATEGDGLTEKEAEATPPPSSQPAKAFPKPPKELQDNLQARLASFTGKTPTIMAGGKAVLILNPAVGVKAMDMGATPIDQAAGSTDKAAGIADKAVSATDKAAGGADMGAQEDQGAEPMDLEPAQPAQPEVVVQGEAVPVKTEQQQQGEHQPQADAEDVHMADVAEQPETNGDHVQPPTSLEEPSAGATEVEANGAAASAHPENGSNQADPQSSAYGVPHAN